MKNYLLKWNIYATGICSEMSDLLRAGFSSCHWMKPNISAELKGLTSQSTQIKMEITSLISACSAFLFTLVKF